LPPPLSTTCTAFCGHSLLAAGPLIEVALAVKAAAQGGASGTLLTFDDATGRVVDLDLRGTDADLVARLGQEADGENVAPKLPRGRGRPKLGVHAREVTLLPQHWEWLAAQPGGASATLRKLVHAARQADAGRGVARGDREVAYRFMSAMAGDLPGFEEATRALFAGRNESLAQQMSAWPADVRAYTLKLAGHAA